MPEGERERKREKKRERKRKERERGREEKMGSRVRERKGSWGRGMEERGTLEIRIYKRRKGDGEG